MISEDKYINDWLESQKPTTKYTYKAIIKHFLKFTGMTGEEIIESRRKDLEKEEGPEKRQWEKRVVEFNTKMRETKSSNYVKSMMGAIRSFFEFHYCKLEFRTSTARKLVEASRKTRDYRFTKEDLYKMYQAGDLVDKYIITVGKCLGFRAIDFIRLTRGVFESYLDREVPIYLGELNTQKENVKAYPFLDQDAVDIIKLMLDKLDQEGRTGPNERMLDFRKKRLTERLQDLAHKIGITSKGKQVRFHNFRKFLFDRLTSVTSDTKAKMIVGKAISEGAYVSPQLLREDYQKVIPLISFKVNNSSKRIEELENELNFYKKILREALTTVKDHMVQSPISSGAEAFSDDVNLSNLERAKTLEKIIKQLSE